MARAGSTWFREWCWVLLGLEDGMGWLYPVWMMVSPVLPSLENGQGWFCTWFGEWSAGSTLFGGWLGLALTSLDDGLAGSLWSGG
jgi:hypothetical protein